MSAENVQTLDDAAVWLMKAGMGQLVGGQRDAKIAAEMPGIQRRLETELPAGLFRECLAAAFHLAAGELDQAHRICQDIPGACGAAWHAIVHRREGDFWNSKYWWRRAAGVGWEGLAERIQRELATAPPEVCALATGGHYDAAGFVDLVEAQHEHGDPAMNAALVAIQRMEWMSLFSVCLRNARMERKTAP